MEKLIEDATKSNFSTGIFISIESNFLLFPAVDYLIDINQELDKLKALFPQLIDNAKALEKINLRVQFLTFQIDALVQQISQQYTQLAKEKWTAWILIQNKFNNDYPHLLCLFCSFRYLRFYWLLF